MLCHDWAVTTSEDNQARTWCLVFALVFLAATAWSLGTPLMSGPDEVSQQRRAAAAARGQWTGVSDVEGPPILVDVEVPELYGEAADQQWRCHVGPLVDAAPQKPLPVPRTECPDLPSSSELVTARTVQGRGQPFLYAVAGLPTRLSTGPAGAYGARLVVAAICAALVASAACSIRALRRPRLAGLGLMLTLTPAVVYLAGSTNPSGVEILAAVGAWVSGTVLVTVPVSQRTGRLVARTMAALVILVLSRGMAPLFGGLIVAGLAGVAGWERCRELLRRRDLQIWGIALAGAVAASGAWLLHIRSAQPNPERLGSGWVTATGYLPWYLHQSVGVFGNNDSDLPMAVSAVWLLLGLAVVVVSVAACLRLVPRAPRAAVLTVLCLVGGLVMQVTSEGLDVPPIGFFWQGRYALPLLFGALVVATVAAGPLPRRLHLAEQRSTFAAVTILVVVHLWAFVEVARHHGGLARGSVSISDALMHTAWDAPVPLWLLTVVYVVSVAALAAVVTAAGRGVVDDADDRGERSGRHEATASGPAASTSIGPR